MSQEISIIIPHYNTPHKLKRMLESIPRTDLMQVIVVDDLSTELIEEYDIIKKEYSDWVEFYDNTPDNKNAGGARNVGLKYARGKWVLFGDADDFYLPNMMQVLQKYFDADEDIIFFPPTSQMDDGLQGESNRHCNYSKLALAYSEIDCKIRFIYDLKKKFAERKLRFYWYSPCSKMIRRSLIEKNDIKFELEKYGNDSLFSVKVGCLAESVLATSEEIYCITEGRKSLSRNDDPEMKKIRAGAAKRCNDYVKQYDNRVLFFLSKLGRIKKSIKG